jgi:hypothetical protein
MDLPDAGGGFTRAGQFSALFVCLMAEAGCDHSVIFCA